MILVVLGVATLIAIVLICCGIKDEWYSDGLAIASGFSVIVVIALVITTLVIAYNVSENGVIDKKIEMYIAENKKIETQIAEIVQGYQEYEEGIFKEVSPDSAVTLVALYPELKTDKLVSEQISIYVQNNEKIKELKEKQINASVVRWWLCFGE